MAELIGQGVATVRELIAFLTKRSGSRDVDKNNLLRELRDNLQLLDHRQKEGVDLSRLIEQLSVAAIREAYANNYPFPKLADKRKVAKEIMVAPRQRKYLDWGADRLVSSIEGKINELKHICLIYNDLQTAPLNLEVRLDNLYYQLHLLSSLIYSKK